MAGPKLHRMASKEDARTLTVLSLMDILTKSLLTKFPERSKGWSALNTIQDKIEVLNEAVPGYVKDEFIVHCERYLAKVQLALDHFWDEVTEQDLLDIRKGYESMNGEGQIKEGGEDEKICQ